MSEPGNPATSLKRIFWPLYIAVFMSSLGLGILSPILPAYVDQFAASSMALGMIFAAYSASRTVFMPPVGRLSDRWGRKPFIVGGLLIFTAVSPLYTLAGSAVELGAVRVLQGLAAAMLMPVAMSYVGSLAPEGREGFIMGSFTSAFFMGLGFGPLIGGLLRDRYSMDAAFYGMGVMAAVALILTSLILPSDRRMGFKQGGVGNQWKVESGRWKEKIEHSDHRINRNFIGLLIFRFCRATGIGFVWVLMPLYAVTELGITAFQVGILLSVNTFLTTLLQSGFGYLSDRFGHLRSIASGALIASTATAAISWCGTFRELVVVSVFLGISGALIVPAGSALAVGIGRTRGMGRTMGMYNSSLSFGTLVGPIAGGIIMDQAGSVAVFPTAGVVGIIGLVVLLVVYTPGLTAKSTEGS